MCVTGDACVSCDLNMAVAVPPAYHVAAVPAGYPVGSVNLTWHLNDKGKVRVGQKWVSHVSHMQHASHAL